MVSREFDNQQKRGQKRYGGKARMKAMEKTEKEWNKVKNIFLDMLENNAGKRRSGLGNCR